MGKVQNNNFVMETRYLPDEWSYTCEEYHLLGYNAVQSVESQPTFRRNILPPFSGSKNKQAELCLPPAYTLVSCSAYFSTMKMEAICSSETSVDFQRTTRRHTPEDSTLHYHRCENLKSYKLYIHVFMGHRYDYNVYCTRRSKGSVIWSYRLYFWKTCYIPQSSPPFFDKFEFQPATAAGGSLGQFLPNLFTCASKANAWSLKTLAC
jgi:hypothetical protein